MLKMASDKHHDVFFSFVVYILVHNSLLNDVLYICAETYIIKKNLPPCFPDRSGVVS